MKKWEYDFRLFDVFDKESLNNSLNKKGQCGWEAWSIERNESYYSVWFKRERALKESDYITDKDRWVCVTGEHQMGFNKDEAEK